MDFSGQVDYLSQTAAIFLSPHLPLDGSGVDGQRLRLLEQFVSLVKNQGVNHVLRMRCLHFLLSVACLPCKRLNCYMDWITPSHDPPMSNDVTEATPTPPLSPAVMDATTTYVYSLIADLVSGGGNLEHQSGFSTIVQAVQFVDVRYSMNFSTI